ncbi:MAG: tetratricopeptide repeat protein [Capnocytophaga sp.]|nr:tetratricopeptide repeat protein [Capnocytophaga sp.]
MKYKKILLLGGLVLSTVAFAQRTEVYTAKNALFQKALSLYHQKQYEPAQHFFQKELQNSENEDFIQQCKYYIASSAIHLGQEGADVQMEQFLKNYPTSPYSVNANLEVANYYFSQGNTKKALVWYDKISPETLTGTEKDKFNFQYGYCLFAHGDKEDAKKYLSQVKNSKEYASKAAYYLGYIAYDSDDYKEANQYFTQVKQEDELSKNLSYYQADMSFKQGNFQNAIQEGLAQLKKTKNPQYISEINKIIGESYFNLKQYKEAIPYLKAYKGKNSRYTNTDLYYLGYAYYKQGDYQNAINNFNQIIDGKNDVAQNAYYHLAECYLKTDQKQQALNAFRNASHMNFNETIKKDAMLNYARLSYDIGNPYESVPTAIQAFINAYPNDYSVEMKELLVDSYVTSGDYKSAMELLEKSNSVADKKIYQQVAFYRALQLYADEDYTQALLYFQKAKGQPDMDINARAIFWSGEINYLLNNYAEAQKNYQDFLALHKNSLSEYPKAYYGLAYSLFNQKKYEQAIENFNKYIETKVEPSRQADSYVRIADSYFVLGKYWPAMDAYNQVINTNVGDTDYAAFQKAISYGFVDRVPNKIENLTDFVKKYLKSNLRQDALFELANTYVAIGDTKKAIPLYQQIQNEYPNGTLTSKAMLREGLVYYNNEEDQKALNIFKEINKKYPNTSEALQAVNSAKGIYAEMGKLNEYAQWVKGLGYVNISDGELDNTAFEVAERQYLKHNKTEAITSLEKYLAQFPNGLNASQARFYLAQLYFTNNQKNKALPLYEKILSEGKNENTEQVLARLSSIYLEKSDNQRATPILKELETSSSIAQNVIYAQSNLMKIYYKIGDYSQTIDYAKKVLANKNVDNRIKNDARTMIARAYIATGDEANAEKYYTEVRKTATDALMAEALYYDAYFKNKAGQYKKSNEIVQKLAKEFGGYKEFSAKGLVVMAKNFYGLKDLYQATYILNSVIDNFKDYPEVVAEAKETLAKIKTNENQNVE